MNRLFASQARSVERDSNPVAPLIWMPALLLGLAPTAAMAALPSQGDADIAPMVEPRFVADEVIVKFKEPTAGAMRDLAQGMTLPEADRLTSGGEQIIKLVGAERAGVLRADAPEADRVMEAVRALSGRDDVQYAQPNWILNHLAVTPNDPLYPQQWHYFTQGSGPDQAPGGIGLPERWETTTGSDAVAVAVIDTGILPEHPDISGSPNLGPGYDMISNTFIANDGDGRDNDPTDPGDAIEQGECGQNYPPRDYPDSWHGTHVAGTIGVGNTDNAAGVAGINWQGQVIPVRVLGKCGGTTADINDAIRWAAGLSVPGVPDNQNPAKVINLSLGAGMPCSQSPSTQAAIDDAVAQGTTVVVAAGNSGEDAANAMPASCDGVITVAASDYRGHLVSRYSNYGETVEIMAPGGDRSRDDNGDGKGDGILSMVKDGYELYNGTSMAAPHVAGVAALLLAETPNLTPQQVLAQLQAAALPRSSNECPEPCGAGLLSASEPPTPDPDELAVAVEPSDVDLAPGDTAEITAVVTLGGSPAPDVEVQFVSQDADVVSVMPDSATTNSLGRAAATLEGIAAGGPVCVNVSADDAEVCAQVTVATTSMPGISTWGLAALVTFMLVWLGWSRRSPRPDEAAS